MITDGKNVNIFSHSKFIQDTLKEKFPEATVAVVDSDNNSYQASFKIQSALNWKKFKGMNLDLVKKGDNLVFLTIRANPFESREDKLAAEFVKYAVKSAFTPIEGKKLKLTVRGWLLDGLRELKEEKTIVDRTGAKVEDFAIYPNRNPMKFAKDKSILIKLYVKVSDVEKVVKALSEYERAPQCIFQNPNRFEELRERKV